MSSISKPAIDTKFSNDKPPVVFNVRKPAPRYKIALGASCWRLWVFSPRFDNHFFALGLPVGKDKNKTDTRAVFVSACACLLSNDTTASSVPVVRVAAAYGPQSAAPGARYVAVAINGKSCAQHKRAAPFHLATARNPCGYIVGVYVYPDRVRP